MFENCEDSLFNDRITIKSQQRFKSDHHRIYTEEVNKMAVSSNDDKRLQTYDRITTYPYGTPAIKVCELDILPNEKAKRLLCTINWWVICNIWVAIRIKIWHKTFVGILTSKIAGECIL